MTTDHAAAAVAAAAAAAAATGAGMTEAVAAAARAAGMTAGVANPAEIGIDSGHNFHVVYVAFWAMSCWHGFDAVAFDVADAADAAGMRQAMLVFGIAVVVAVPGALPAGPVPVAYMSCCIHIGMGQVDESLDWTDEMRGGVVAPQVGSVVDILQKWKILQKNGKVKFAAE